MKVYVAEEREDRIFGEGIDKLFANVARTLTATSLVGAGATLIVGLIGVIMIIVGGNAILAGTMTLGGFVMYIFSSAWSPRRSFRLRLSARRSPKRLPG